MAKHTEVYHVRWAIRSDLWEMVAIERASFSDPMDEGELVDCLRQRNMIGMVCVADEAFTVGHMIYEIHRDHIALVTMAVYPEFRRDGAGTAMIAKLKTKLSHQRRRFITVMVAESNLGAQLFFRSQGFIATDVARGWFDETGEDGYVMELYSDE